MPSKERERGRMVFRQQHSSCCYDSNFEFTATKFFGKSFSSYITAPKWPQSDSHSKALFRHRHRSKHWLTTNCHHRWNGMKWSDSKYVLGPGKQKDNLETKLQQFATCPHGQFSEHAQLCTFHQHQHQLDCDTKSRIPAPQYPPNSHMPILKKVQRFLWTDRCQISFLTLHSKQILSLPQLRTSNLCIGREPTLHWQGFTSPES